MARTVVLIPDRLDPPADIEQQVFGPDTEIVLGQTADPSRVAAQDWARSDAILVWHDMTLSREVIAKMDRCKVIVRVGTGFDNVDLAAAGERGIYVCNVPDYGTNDVADHALALLLTLARGIPAYDRGVRDGTAAGWAWAGAGKLRRLAGSTLGIVGLGRIGTAAALRGKAFGMRVVVYDPYIPDGVDKALGVTRVDDLAMLAAESDTVSFHVPLTPETRGMGNAAFFSQLRPGAIVVNTARGSVIAFDALADALKSGRVGAAGLDVVEQEPPDPSHWLIRAWRAGEPWIRDRLVITPHSAFYCEGSYNEMRDKAAREAQGVLAGKPPRNCVNRAWLKIG